MSSGFFFDSVLRASSLEASRRAVVVKARRAMWEAIVAVVGVGELKSGKFGVAGLERSSAAMVVQGWMCSHTIDFVKAEARWLGA